MRLGRFDAIVLHVGDIKSVSLRLSSPVADAPAAKWKEELHPRDPDGKFAKKGAASPSLGKVLPMMLCSDRWRI